MARIGFMMMESIGFLGYQQNINIVWDCVGYPRFVVCEWEAYEKCSSSITFEDTSYGESYPMFRRCAEPNAINLKLGMIETQSISRFTTLGGLIIGFTWIYHIRLRLLKHIETIRYRSCVLTHPYRTLDVQSAGPNGWPKSRPRLES